MNNSQNHNTAEYSNIDDIQTLYKQLGGAIDEIGKAPNKDDIEQIKIQMKIYVRLFLYIQFKLDKKFNKSSSSGDSMNRFTQQTLIDSMQSYKEDVAAQTELQSVDLFFIKPLFESMCKDNYDDICISYFNNIIKPNQDIDPDSTKDFMEQILSKYEKLLGDYEELGETKSYKELVALVRSYKGKLTSEDFSVIANKIKTNLGKADEARQAKDAAAAPPPGAAPAGSADAPPAAPAGSADAPPAAPAGSAAAPPADAAPADAAPADAAPDLKADADAKAKAEKDPEELEAETDAEAKAKVDADAEAKAKVDADAEAAAKVKKDAEELEAAAKVKRDAEELEAKTDHGKGAADDRILALSAEPESDIPSLPPVEPVAVIEAPASSDRELVLQIDQQGEPSDVPPTNPNTAAVPVPDVEKLLIEPSTNSSSVIVGKLSPEKDKDGEKPAVEVEAAKVEDEKEVEGARAEAVRAAAETAAVRAAVAVVDDAAVVDVPTTELVVKGGPILDDTDIKSEAEVDAAAKVIENKNLKAALTRAAAGAQSEAGPTAQTKFQKIIDERKEIEEKNKKEAQETSVKEAKLNEAADAAVSDAILVADAKTDAALASANDNVMLSGHDILSSILAVEAKLAEPTDSKNRIQRIAVGGAKTDVRLDKINEEIKVAIDESGLNDVKENDKPQSLLSIKFAFKKLMNVFIYYIINYNLFKNSFFIKKLQNIENTAAYGVPQTQGEIDGRLMNKTTDGPKLPVGLKDYLTNNLTTKNYNELVELLKNCIPITTGTGVKLDPYIISLKTKIDELFGGEKKPVVAIDKINNIMFEYMSKRFKNLYENFDKTQDGKLNKNKYQADIELMTTFYRIIKVFTEHFISELKVIATVENKEETINILEKYAESEVISYVKIRDNTGIYNPRYIYYTDRNGNDNKNKTLTNDTLSLLYCNDPTKSIDLPIDEPNSRSNESIKYDHLFHYGYFDKIFYNENNRMFGDNMGKAKQKLISGKDVFIIGYGASGAGKTTTLIYDNNDTKNPDGAIVYMLQGLAKEDASDDINFTKLNLTIKEIFMDDDPALIGNVKTVDKVDNINFEFNPEKDQFSTKISKVNYKKALNSLIGNETQELDIEFEKIWNETKPDEADTTSFSLSVILQLLIDKKRKISATSNNPQSSRSHAIAIMEFGYKDKKTSPNKKVQLIIGDFAGVENKFDYTFKYVKDDENIGDSIKRGIEEDTLAGLDKNYKGQKLSLVTINELMETLYNKGVISQSIYELSNRKRADADKLKGGAKYFYQVEEKEFEDTDKETMFKMAEFLTRPDIYNEKYELNKKTFPSVPLSIKTAETAKSILAREQMAENEIEIQKVKRGLNPAGEDSKSLFKLSDNTYEIIHFSSVAQQQKFDFTTALGKSTIGFELLSGDEEVKSINLPRKPTGGHTNFTQVIRHYLESGKGSPGSAGIKFRNIVDTIGVIPEQYLYYVDYFKLKYERDVGIQVDTIHLTDNEILYKRLSALDNSKRANTGLGRSGNMIMEWKKNPEGYRAGLIEALKKFINGRFIDINLKLEEDLKKFNDDIDTRKADQAENIEELRNQLIAYENTEKIHRTTIAMEEKTSEKYSDYYLQILNRVVQIHYELIKRTYEGVFINRSLQSMRSTMTDVLKAKAQGSTLIPNFNSKCINYYTNPLTDEMFGPKTDEDTTSGNKDDKFNTIHEILANAKSPDQTKSIRDKLKSDLIYCVCLVLNNSYKDHQGDKVNNPPKIPYIDLTEGYIELERYRKRTFVADDEDDNSYYKQIIFKGYGLNVKETKLNPKMDKIDRDREQLLTPELKKNITSIIGYDYNTFIDKNLQIEIFNNIHKNTVFCYSAAIKKQTIASSKLDDIMTKYRTLKDFVEQGDKPTEVMIKTINDYLNEIEVMNATSVIGTLDFADQISKYNLKFNACSVVQNNILYNSELTDKTLYYNSKYKFLSKFQEPGSIYGAHLYSGRGPPMSLYWENYILPSIKNLATGEGALTNLLKNKNNSIEAKETPPPEEVEGRAARAMAAARAAAARAVKAVAGVGDRLKRDRNETETEKTAKVPRTREGGGKKHKRRTKKNPILKTKKAVIKSKPNSKKAKKAVKKSKPTRKKAK